MSDDEVYEELRRKYVEKLRESLGQEEAPRTRQYEEFRQEYLPRPLSWYEKACNLSASLLKVSPDKKKRPALEEAIATCHLQTTPEGTTSFALTLPLLSILATVTLFYVLPVLLGGQGNLFVAFYLSLIALVAIIPLGRIPYFIANAWRMRASNQMVLCIFYIVTYMRHTSNLELAIDFAAEHLDAPLSLDMKKIIWNLETEKYGSLKESLEAYLGTWRKWNDEFIESMHLVESSLVETSEPRRIEALDKSLSVMLEETYEKMLHYAHNLKGPLTTLHMLGIILPILGLVILPLLVAFMPSVRWYHLFLLYNVTLPVIVYLIGRNILSKRPTGYGASDADSAAGKGPVTVLGVAVTPLIVCVLVAGLLVLGGALPLLVHAANPDFDMVSGTGQSGCPLGFCSVDIRNKDQTQDAKYWFLEYRDIVVDETAGISQNRGPFGLGATLFSLLIPLAAGLGVGLYFSLRSRGSLQRRQQAKKLELEFASALFQLGNRLADGLPLEIAFSKVAVVLPDTISGRFFDQVSANITRLGLSVEDAIFHEKYGALREYPSSIIESSMKVLVESSKKGPIIASQAVINVSNYIKEMHRVDERLKDLMADVISSMKSQIKFLTPTIAAVVIGSTSMITAHLGKLSTRLGALQQQTGGAQQLSIGSGLLGGMTGGVPTYFFQGVVGLYVVQIVFILTVLVSGIENGSDKTGERSMLGENLIHSTLTYVAISFIVILLFNVVAANIVPAAGG